MEENKELNEETLAENEAVEVEETVEEVAEEVTEDVAEEVAETEEFVEGEVFEVAEEAPVQKKSSKVLTQVIAAIVSVVVIVALTVFLTPRVKYLYAMSLANNGKADKAYKILCEIDGGYKKAEQALKRFVVIPTKVTNTEKSSMGDAESTYTREIKTEKNKMIETLKDDQQSQITTSTYDEKGNVIKEEISQPESGGKYICTYKYNKDGKRTHYLVESEGTKVYEAKYEYDKDGNCTFTSIFEMGYMGESTTETKNEDFKVYYIKSK